MSLAPLIRPSRPVDRDLLRGWASGGTVPVAMLISGTGARPTYFQDPLALCTMLLAMKDAIKELVLGLVEQILTICTLWRDTLPPCGAEFLSTPELQKFRKIETQLQTKVYEVVQAALVSLIDEADVETQHSIWFPASLGIPDRVDTLVTMGTTIFGEEVIQRVFHTGDHSIDRFKENIREISRNLEELNVAYFSFQAATERMDRKIIFSEACRVYLSAPLTPEPIPEPAPAAPEKRQRKSPVENP